MAPPLIPATPVSKAGPQQQAKGAIAATIEPTKEALPMFVFIIRLFLVVTIGVCAQKSLGTHT